VIHLGSFLHRNEMAEIIGRALEDRLLPDDAHRLKEIVNFNSYCLRVYSSQFADRLFAAVRGSGVRVIPAKTKGELKDLIAANPHFVNRRIEELREKYRKYPLDYYRDTPYEGTMYTIGNPPRYVGSRRIKRIRRIAEKCGRRIVDYMFDQVRARADELAEERAQKLGVPRNQLVTPPEEMIAEFQHAERRVLKSIREGLFVAAMPRFHIDDVVGIRILIDPQAAPRVDEYLASLPGLSVVDEKRFIGRFSGRNMVVAARLSRDDLLMQPPKEAATQVLISRGVARTREAVAERYADFVLHAEDHVRFEILQIEYEQLLESEIGRSQHEEHVIELRDKSEYGGRLAQNVEALMIFLFAWALSARTGYEPLPIKLCGTYLPDYFDSVFRTLWETSTGSLGLTM
jgi:hypothetical protein